jgi:asparagine synthetase B (glutamine-hydrolysing)
MIAPLTPRGPDGTAITPSPASAWATPASASSTSRAAISRSTTKTAPSGRCSTARSSTTSSCAPTSSAGPPLLHPLRHRGHRPPLRPSTATTSSSRLNGQFAIALWDAPRRRLLLVRDRAGHPAAVLPRRLAVAVRLRVKALLPAGGAGPSLERCGADQLMTFWAPVSPDTVFKGVQEPFAPAHAHRRTPTAARSATGTGSSDPKTATTLPGSDEDLAAELRELLVDATRLQLRADVPVGAYLSAAWTPPASSG